MKKAILAAEDERFYSPRRRRLSVGAPRRAATNVTSGTQQGAGTITMQVARNFFLTREKTLTRKLREVLLAWKIEGSLSKDEILELYVNQIFLGQRAYGFAAASQIYFGKPLQGRHASPKRRCSPACRRRPPSFNPVTNPKRAKARQQYVLRRMHELRYINDGDSREAQNAPLASSARACAKRSRSTPSSRPRWRGRSCSRRTATRPTRKGLTVWTTIRTRRPGSRICRCTRGVTRLRPSARLPRTRGLREPARRPGRSRAGARARVRRKRPTATTC